MVDLSTVVLPPELDRDAWLAFFAHRTVARPNGCIEWTRCRDRQGYGRAAFQGRTERTHRVSYLLARGPIGADLFVCHHCDNPPCCNPVHLFLGTNQDNVSDLVAKGLKLRGSATPSARLTEAQVVQIRELLATGTPQRQIAGDFGIAQSHVCRINKGRRWAHLA